MVTPVVATSGLARIRLASTFLDKQGRYCREIEITSISSDEPQSASIACRTVGGSWQVEGSVVHASGDAVTTPGIAPSASDENEPLADLLRSLGAGRVLSSKEAEAALASGWK